MFDLRYHVVSLAAVFLALVVGIVVGVGISDRAFPRGTERQVLEEEIEDLQREVDSLRAQHADDVVVRKAADAILRQTYPQLVSDRLRGRRVGVVYVGPVDEKVDGRVRRALGDAGAPPVLRLRALKVPIDQEAIDRALAGRPALAAFAGPENLSALGRRLGEELVPGARGKRRSGIGSRISSSRSGRAAIAQRRMRWSWRVRPSRSRGRRRGSCAGCTPGSRRATPRRSRSRARRRRGRRHRLPRRRALDGRRRRHSRRTGRAGAPPGRWPAR